jgi:hypothetical protein
VEDVCCKASKINGHFDIGKQMMSVCEVMRYYRSDSSLSLRSGIYLRIHLPPNDQTRGR